MALVPMLFGGCWDDYMDSPFRASRIICKQFDSDPFPGGFLLSIDDKPRRCERKRCRRLSRCGNDDGKTKVVAKKAPVDFQVILDVQQFKPDEISVKATEKYVTVEGKHEQKGSENGYVLKHFVRRYQLPEGHDNDKIASTLSSDGVLTISAPKLALPGPERERTITVEQSAQSDQNEMKSEANSGRNFTLEDMDE